MRDGDLNTKFFHLSATTRRRFKNINMLLNEENQVIKDQAGLYDVAKSYFRKLFEAKEGVYDPVLAHIYPRINVVDNTKLLDPINKAELYEALKHIHPDTSPGTNGFNPIIISGKCVEMT